MRKMILVQRTTEADAKYLGEMPEAHGALEVINAFNAEADVIQRNLHKMAALAL